MTTSPDRNNTVDLNVPMSLEALAAAFIALREDFAALAEENKQLKARIAWFEKQLFGGKSEKRVIENPYQDDFLTPLTTTPAEPEVKITVSYERGTAKKVRPDDCATDTGLRFSDEVPVEIIRITPPELLGDGANDYEIVDTKISRKLAQQPASYVVLQYETPVIKHKATAAITNTPMPAQVLDSSIADVSLLVGLLVDKFLYHLPLYRHDCMDAGGRATQEQLPNINAWACKELR